MDGDKDYFINKIKEMVPFYTPEWRFDEENPDLGSALAMIFAEMMEDTVHKYNRIYDRNKIFFFDRLGAVQLPAKASKGFVSFGLVNDEVSGCFVQKGTKLYGDGSGGSSITFETTDTLYVTPSDISCIYTSDGEGDGIYSIYDKKSGSPEGFRLFEKKGENLQEHLMYIISDTVFSILREGRIQIEMIPVLGETIPEKIMEEFLNRENVSIDYYSSDGYCPFEKRTYDGNRLVLYKVKGQPEPEKAYIEDTEGFCIRIAVYDISVLEKIFLKNIFISSDANCIEPDSVMASGIEREKREFLPFGEKPVPYEEMYIISNEALGKRGAGICLSFELKYMELSTEDNAEQISHNWKTIMKKSDFKEEKQYDVTVSEVLWEYYNGYGWKRLFDNNTYSDVFNGSGKGEYKRKIELHFTCPGDIRKFMVNSSDSFCIRVRVLKVDNMFKPKGRYVTPVIINPRLSYEYKSCKISPQMIVCHNNMETKCIRKIPSEGFAPFLYNNDGFLRMYFGFTKPFEELPVRLLVSVNGMADGDMPYLKYEYFAESGLKGRWRDLNVEDETYSMRQTGIISLLPDIKMEEHSIYGRKLYWIRITDISKAYGTANRKYDAPFINSISMNSTSVCAVEHMQPEKFLMTQHEEKKECRLLNGNVNKAVVWVNEIKSISENEIKSMERSDVRFEYDINGNEKCVWIKWKQVDSFGMSEGFDRHYILDSADGVIRFSDGIHGKIPDSGDEETILVEYCCGGGIDGNLSEGSINRMEKSIGFINRVYNPEVTAGGCDMETLQEALSRHSGHLSHGGRAVTPKDCERLAMEASRSILRAKCYVNYDASGRKNYGHITLAAVQRDYMEGGKYFPFLKDEIWQYLEGKMSEYLMYYSGFHIIEPEFIELRVEASVITYEINGISDLKKRIEENLAKFLNPINGNFNGRGFDIGVIPDRSQIANAIKMTDGVAGISKIRIIGFNKSHGEKKEIDLDDRNGIYRLPVNGEHRIYVTAAKSGTF